jgi:hypothetical protein
MVLLNASSRSRNVARLVVQDQGGGEKKAGLPYLVGRTASSSMFIDKDFGKCDLPSLKLPISSIVNQSRSVGNLARSSTRFSMNF